MREPYRPCSVRAPGPNLFNHLRRGWRTLCGLTVDDDVPSVDFSGRKLCATCSAISEQQRRSDAMTKGMSHFGRR